MFKSPSACSVATRNSEATIPLGIYMCSHVRSLTPLGAKSRTNPAYASYLASLRLLVPFSIYREKTVSYRSLDYLSNLYGYSTTFEPGFPSNRRSQATNLAQPQPLSHKYHCRLTRCFSFASTDLLRQSGLQSTSKPFGTGVELAARHTALAAMTTTRGPWHSTLMNSYWLM